MLIRPSYLPSIIVTWQAFETEIQGLFTQIMQTTNDKSAALEEAKKIAVASLQALKVRKALKTTSNIESAKF
jgi:hypothetical protein